MSNKVYACENSACWMGARNQPGYFTGGMTQEQAYLLTGNPEAPYGEGICPNCGEQAVDTGETHKSVKAKDDENKGG